MSRSLDMSVRQESWPLAKVFRIARHASTEAEVIVVELADGEHTGRGECSPTAHYGESVASVVDQLESSRQALQQGADRAQLAQLLPPGAARNALDCALWDLQAKQTGRRVWQLAGFDALDAVTTAYTLSIDGPAAMGAAARDQAARPLLKLKMAGDGQDLDRVEAVRANAPEAEIIVDANESWSIENYRDLVPAFAKLRVAMVEQPFPADADEVLALLARPIPVCADESCHTRADLARLAGRYDLVNIKLDKTGGLSEALALREQALSDGFGIMVGCMIGTSLAMAPAIVAAQGARFVDIDGPLLLAEDRRPGLDFSGSLAAPSTPQLWG